MEFLLWACICLETSIPLMTARFLAWRATLYCAVCQCYYDSQANVQAEVFARRALGKVSELGKLEEMSGLPATTETQRAYKVATIKVWDRLIQNIASFVQCLPTYRFKRHDALSLVGM